MQDELMWISGRYTLEAFSVTLANAFAEKGKQPVEYRKMSYTAEYKENHRVLTEEEKQEQIQMLFGNLAIMQSNFERTHGDRRNA